MNKEDIILSKIEERTDIESIKQILKDLNIEYIEVKKNNLKENK